MNEAIGFIEFSSIAKGIEAADTILKTAETRLLFAKETCPGKYNILFSGQVAAVSASMEAAKRMAGHFAIDSVVIPRLHPQVVPAISQTSQPAAVGALGVMEFYNITGAVWAGDAAAKAADVSLLNIRLATGIGGKSFVVLSGQVAAVGEAVKVGAQQPQQAGMLVATTVIPNPRAELFDTLL